MTSQERSEGFQHALSHTCGPECSEMPCIVCDRVNHTRWRIPLAKEVTRSREINLCITRCRRCGHVYQCPEISKAYGDKYFDDRYESAGEDNPYYDPELKLEHARDLLKVLQMHHPAARNVLEIGAGMGTFASVAQAAGLKVVGTEMSEMAVRKARDSYGVSLHLGPLDTLPQDNLFDTVVLWDVIEHCPRAELLMAELSCRCRLQGRVFLTTGNYESTARLASGANWWCWQPDHYHYFRPENISRLGERNGLGEFVVASAPRIKYPEKICEKPAQRSRLLRFSHPFRSCSARGANVYSRLRWPRHYDIGIMLCVMTKVK